MSNQYQDNRNQRPQQNNGSSSQQSFKKIFRTNEKSHYSKPNIEEFRNDASISIRSEHKNIPDPYILWKDGEFSQDILRVINDAKFQQPTPIQSQILPILLSGHDSIAIAETGSGKTWSFLIPGVIHVKDQQRVERGQGPVMLILSPTRELAVQIQKQVDLFCRQMDLKSIVIYGGVDKFPQANALERGVEIVVATPGRFIDFLEGGQTNVRRITFLVLDEADRMLDMGFEPQVRQVVNQIRKDRQTCFFSATWPRDVQKLARELCQQDPIHIQIGTGDIPINKMIVQHITILNQNQKTKELFKILENLTREDKVLIFAKTRRRCEELSQELTREAYDCLALHGDKSQNERDSVMRQLDKSSYRIVVATDLASRGLDVREITHVINYDFPNCLEDYVHRIGRTGRAGDKGVAISFICEGQDDSNLIKQLKSYLEKADQKVSEELIQFGNNNSSGYRGRGNQGFNRGRNDYPNRRGNDNGNQGRFNNRDNGDQNEQPKGSRFEYDRHTDNRGGDRNFKDNNDISSYSKGGRYDNRENMDQGRYNRDNGGRNDQNNDFNRDVRNNGDREVYNRDNGGRINQNNGERESFNKDNNNRGNYNRDGGERGDYNRGNGNRGEYDRDNGDHGKYNQNFEGRPDFQSGRGYGQDRNNGDRERDNRGYGGRNDQNYDSRNFNDRNNGSRNYQDNDNRRGNDRDNGYRGRNNRDNGGRSDYQSQSSYGQDRNNGNRGGFNRDNGNRNDYNNRVSFNRDDRDGNRGNSRFQDRPSQKDEVNDNSRYQNRNPQRGDEVNDGNSRYQDRPSQDNNKNDQVNEGNSRYQDRQGQKSDDVNSRDQGQQNQNQARYPNKEFQEDHSKQPGENQQGSTKEQEVSGQNRQETFKRGDYKAETNQRYNNQNNREPDEPRTQKNDGQEENKQRNYEGRAQIEQNINQNEKSSSRYNDGEKQSQGQQENQKVENQISQEAKKELNEPTISRYQK